MNVILYDDLDRGNLLPLVFAKPIGDLRIGIYKISEKWGHLGISDVSFLTEDYLSRKYPPNYTEEQYYINGRIVPTTDLLDELKGLGANECLAYNGEVIGFKTDDRLSMTEVAKFYESLFKKEFEGDLIIVNAVWDIFLNNGAAIALDIKQTSIKSLQVNSLPDSSVYGEDLYIESTAKARGCIFNTESGPIYLGKNTEVMEGSVIRGPFALCDHGVVKLQTKIYGATTVGPFSKVGGELNNSVIQGYSNKGHDGFLGNSVIGEWCNLGADTNNSNLKNNYGPVKMWNYLNSNYVNSGRQFLGLIMGDHSKCGINTMFNTGTVVGLSANVFGGGFPKKFIPSFSWGGVSGWSDYDFEKSIEVAERMMERRGVELTALDKEIFKHIYLTTSQFRS